MPSETNVVIADTALMVSWMRAQDPRVSLDRWAVLWSTPAAEAIGREYAAITGELNMRAVGLRHRFCAEALLQFQAKHGAQIRVVNIGSGFTSYPQLLASEHQSIEVDLPHVVEHRERRLAELAAQERIPQRNIEFLPLDLCGADALSQLQQVLLTFQPKRPTIIVLEGILYYLPLKVVDQLLELLGNTLQPGDQIITVAWSDAVQRSAMFARIDTYFTTRLQRAPQNYTFLDEDYFASRSNIIMQEHLRYPDIEQRYLRETLLEPVSYLDESLYVLRVGGGALGEPRRES